jgi:uncharacterized membrane protein YeaQ/YmgE (transglycosylase-associated protein family)
MTNAVTILAVGILIGWVASARKPSNTPYFVLINVVIGVVGAALGAWIAAPASGGRVFLETAFGGDMLLISFSGAVALLVLAHWIAWTPPRP